MVSKVDWSYSLCATIYIAERRLSRIFTAIGARRLLQEVNMNNEDAC
jgi:hypothetical protein